LWASRERAIRAIGADRFMGRAVATLRRNAVVLTGFVLATIYAVVAARLELDKDIGAVAYGALSLVVAGSLLRRLRFDRGTTAILLGGLVLYYLYLGYTSPGERNYDGPEQLDKYIGYILANHRLPLTRNQPPDGCFICHHPPFYYVLGAIAEWAFEATNVAPKPVNLQVFSLAIFFAFLVHGVLLARLLSGRTRTVRITAALLVFWPYSVHNSVRIHNDTLVTALVAAGMYYAARWYKQGRPRHLYAAGACAALGVLTKSSALALVAILGLLLAWRFFTRSGRMRLFRRGVVAMAMVAAAYGGIRLRTLDDVRRGMPVPDECHRTFGSACDMRKSDFTGNRPINYLYLDVPKLLRDPYMVIQGDASGKQFFWNHVIKSSLFGTHNKVADRETAYSLNRKLGFVMNVGLFAMLIYAAIAGLAGLARGRRGLREAGLPLLFVVVSSATLMGFKIAIPAPHHTDFRHIYFAIAPATLLYALAIEHMRSRHRLLGAVGTALYVPFLALSIVYFLPKYELVMAYTKETIEMPLASLQKIVPEWSAWDRDGNTLLEGNQTLSLAVGAKVTVSKIDATLDGNDVYEIRLFSKGKPRVIVVRPKKNLKPGLARHSIEVKPPAENVDRLTIRPLSGDRTYSIGHLILE
jgi:4-amino-4-deoxy-L-arabinose transferase-like glycosyltransferase